MKKGYYILFGLIFLSLLLTACGDNSITIPGENGEEMKINLDDTKDGGFDISVDGENGEGFSMKSDGENLVMEDGENQFSSQSGNNVSLPEGFPTDFPIPEGVNIIHASTMTDNDTNSKIYSVQYHSQDDMATLADIYKSYAQSKGINIGMENQSQDTYQLFPDSESGADTFSLTLLKEEDVTVASIQVYRSIE